MPMNRHSHDERYEILIEREVRGELSDQEKAELEDHVATCTQCRWKLSQTMKEFDTMTDTTDILAEQFDFDKARRGIENYIRLGRHRWWLMLLSVPVMIIFSIILAATISIWLAIVVGGQFLIVAGILMVIDRRRNRRIRANLESNDSSLVYEYARHLRRAGSDIHVGRKLLIAASAIVVIVAALDALADDHWILAGILIVGAAIWFPLVLRFGLSREKRERDQLLVEGEISFDEYRQTGTVRNHDDMDKV